VMISALESEEVAKNYLLEGSLSKRDALVDFSLIPAGPLEAPRRLSGLEIVIDDLPEAFAVPSEGGQSCSRSGGRLQCRIDRSAALAQGEPRRYLAATLAAPSNLGQIRELAEQITKNSRSPGHSVALLIRWMDANIAKEAIDAFTAVDVLRETEGEVFDEDFFAYKEDVDVAWRLRLLGWKAQHGVDRMCADAWRWQDGVGRSPNLG